MTQPGNSSGFGVALTELQTAWHDALPKLEGILRGQLTVLRAHEGLDNPAAASRVPMAQQFSDTYAGFLDDIATRQESGANNIDTLAQKLRKVHDLYARVDGQG